MKRSDRRHVTALILSANLQSQMSRSSPSTYLEIKAYVRDKIESGAWQAGDLIPSEHELVREFGVARMTVNRALRELTVEQLLMRVQGTGTFVADRRSQSTLVEICSIGEEIASRGHKHTSEVVLLGRSTDGQSLRILGLERDAFAFHSQLVHFENDIPVQFEDRFVNPALFPDYLQQDFSTTTPSDYMTRRAPIRRVQYSITARKASAEVRKLLRMEVGEPCMVLHRCTWSGPLAATSVFLWYPGGRLQLTGEF